MKWDFLFILTLASALSALSACATPLTYSADPIEAKVIDADTKQPLEGVIVTANWQLESGNAGGSFVVGQMMVMEALTNKEGVFHFPAWGPLKLRQGVMSLNDPQLLLFKSGYAYRRLNNYREGVSLEGLWRAPVRSSQWNGKTIELKPFKGPLAEYKRHFDDWNTDLDQIIRWNPKECNWKKLPEAILATERERLEQKYVDPQTLGSVYRALVTYQNDWYTKEGGPGCGSPKAFFQRYKP